MVCPTEERQRSVHFAPDQDLCEYQEGPAELSIEGICDQWFQPEDFDEFRASAQRASVDAVRKGMSAYIKRTYGYIDDRTQDMLILWAKCRNTRRGLERFINVHYARDRLFVRQKTVDSVLITQHRLKCEGESYERSAEVIRNVAIILSTDAIDFAIMLARADERAASSRGSRTRKQASASDVPVVSNHTVLSESEREAPATSTSPTSDDSDSCCSTVEVASKGVKRSRHPENRVHVSNGRHEIKVAQR